MADTVSRNFSLEEMSRITEHSIRAGINLIPYVCRECMDCLQTITNCIRAVRTHNITPERFWNGDPDDYSYLILGIVFIIRSPYPLVQVYAFYLISFLLIYNFFYLLFYCYALIGNCIRLYKLKNTLEIISKQTKSIPVSAIEFQVDFLVAKLLKNKKEDAKTFYSELIKLAEESNSDNNSEMLAYLKERYSSHLNSN